MEIICNTKKTVVILNDGDLEKITPTQLCGVRIDILIVPEYYSSKDLNILESNMYIRGKLHTDIIRKKSISSKLTEMLKDIYGNDKASFVLDLIDSNKIEMTFKNSNTIILKEQYEFSEFNQFNIETLINKFDRKLLEVLLKKEKTWF